MKTLSKLLAAAMVIAWLAGPCATSAQQTVPIEAPRPDLKISELPPGCGFIPPNIDLSHLANIRHPQRSIADTAPARWDWRSQGAVTAIRNQSVCGACYSFASIASFESRLLIDGAGTYDFSENNAKECNWYQTSCGGGNFNEVASFFSQYGTVLETCDPYVASDVSCNSSCAYIKSLLDWRIISGDNVPDAATLKDYIYNYGPIYTSLYAGDGSVPSWQTEFNNYDGSYVLYYTGTETPNHAVCIVGYDDTLSHAGGQGAWIVKNSWGTSWGGTCGYGAESGYFKIAYGSASIGKWSSFVDGWQDYDATGEVLFYDEGGWTSSWGYGATTCWSLSKFTPSGSVYLRRVELWTTDATTDIDVYVYDDFDGSAPSNLLTSELNSSFGEAGYHSIRLTSPPLLSSGNAVYVVVQIVNSSGTNPIAADNQGGAETATTYMSSNGAGGSWYDLGLNQGDDIGVRIRVSSTVGIDDDYTLNRPGSPIAIRNYPNPFNNRTTIEYSLPSDGHVVLQVFDILGRHVETLINGFQAAGNYQTDWDSRDLTSGYYFYKIQSGSSVQTGQMLLLK